MDTKLAKSAYKSKFGDVYWPRDRPIDPFDYNGYLTPVADHVHIPNDDWHKDIDCQGRSGRRAALLVGDPDSSFLWDCPAIYYVGESIGRGQRKSTLQTLLKQLDKVRA